MPVEDATDAEIIEALEKLARDAIDAGTFVILEADTARNYYIQFAVQRPALFSVMFQPTVYRADDPGVVAARAATTALLRQGVGQATDSPTSAAAFGAWAFVHGIAALVLGGAIDGDAIELYERAAVALFPAGPPAV